MSHFTIESLTALDLDEIVLAFQKIGWHKSRDLYESYLEEQALGKRLCFIARENGKFCGYVTLKQISDYSYLKENNIPKIADNVLSDQRKKGIGTGLIQVCEQLTKEQRRTLIGLGVGLTSDYGNAQRLYVKLGYLLDGKGKFIIKESR